MFPKNNWALQENKIGLKQWLGDFETKLEETCVLERDASQYISPGILIVATRQPG